MNAKKRSASRCTARGEPAVSRRAVVVLPAPGGPVRIRTGSPPSIAAAILERLLLAAAPALAALVVAAAVVAASAAVRLVMAADLGGAVPGGRRAVPRGREGRLVRAAAVARRPGAVMGTRAAAAMAMRRGRALVARARA